MNRRIEVTNPIDLINSIVKESKRSQKGFLTWLEQNYKIVGYEEIRKYYLDNINDLVRNLIAIVIGREFAELFMKKRK